MRAQATMFVLALGLLLAYPAPAAAQCTMKCQCLPGDGCGCMSQGGFGGTCTATAIACFVGECMGFAVYTAADGSPVRFAFADDGHKQFAYPAASAFVTWSVSESPSSRSGLVVRRCASHVPRYYSSVEARQVRERSRELVI